MVLMHQEGVDPIDDRTMTMPRTLTILAVIATRTEAEAVMMLAATWVSDATPMRTMLMMTTRTVVMVVAVMVGMRQEGVDRDDDRTMTMTRTMITVPVIEMTTEGGRDDVGSMWRRGR